MSEAEARYRGNNERTLPPVAASVFTCGLCGGALEIASVGHRREDAGRLHVRVSPCATCWADAYEQGRSAEGEDTE